eukprot:CAMPEP_0203685310 /NCGR_PEP_ID=MMETSP0090-20130426/48480_1 /ASSEMBLY_ACC=CAM_ASM_001088 /TAXON_ID=426623 /ORGANISM="Chaetoceros affinis, Strain CCMP159" /LENGTH=783 /DNA_ID=CAMNT_0050554499 /DNA_START=156 /DNA_END=2504 /DNA_ORIENTATION=+
MSEHEPTQIDDADTTMTDIDALNAITGNTNENLKDTHSKSRKKPNEVKSKKKRKKEKEDASLQFTWICVECKEAECVTHPDSPLLVCEGPCRRPFHYPCAGLPSIPPADEQWICSDCLSSRHMCCVCNQYGDDGVDVYKCDKKDCGLFYHEACLNMYDVDVQVVNVLNNETSSASTANANDNNTKNMKHGPTEETENAIEQEQARDEAANESSLAIAKITEASTMLESTLPKKVTSRPKFVCPAHSCWTCSGGPPPSDQYPSCDGNCVSNNSGNGISNDQQQNKKKKEAKKKQKKSTIDAAFCEKKDKGLFRCLKCPIAYHISCIPPSAKFHELALLCHEHSSSSKLPYLDVESSLQKGVEDRADRMIAAASSLAKKRKNGEDGSFSSSFLKKQFKNDANPFLPGKTFVNGDWMTPYDRQIMDLLIKSDELQHSKISKKVLSSFCLPDDIQKEVYSKPPVYAHIHSNRYDPNHRPKRHPPSTELCECNLKSSSEGITCDEHCMNRISGIECVGDFKKRKDTDNPYWNCACGPDCGNRFLSKRQFAKCRPKREQGKGWGLITVNGVQKGKLVLEYVGEIIDEKMKRNRLDAWSKDHPNDPNFYIMQLQSGWYIDAREKGGLSRFINHSCDPNCHLMPVNVSGYMRVAIVASKNIAPGEFLSYDYHFDTQDGDKFVCRCGASNCRGTMKEGKLTEGDNDKKLTKNERWLSAKSKLDRDKKFIEEIAKTEKGRLNQTCATLPGEVANNSITVASGPEMSSALKGREYRVCLRRNVLAGSNFSSRYW